MRSRRVQNVLVIAAALYAQILADVGRQGHLHPGEHHGIVQRNKFEGRHVIETTPNG